MRRARLLSLLVLMACSRGVYAELGAPHGQATAPASARGVNGAGNPRVLITTALGDIEVELEPTRASETVANFLKYVDGAFYNGGSFHRTVRADNQPTDTIRIAVVQGGMNPERRADRFPPIALERTSVTGIRHVAGAISMARGAPDSASSDFFICLDDTPALDFGGMRNPDGQGFAAFGRVVRGLDVVRRIQTAPANAQQLTPAIPIITMARVSPGIPQF